MATVVVAATLALACASWHPRPQPSAPGKSLALAGPTFGRREVQPTQCVAGGHAYFQGADLVDEPHHLVVRAVDDPIEGMVVRVYDAEDSDRTSFVARRGDCRTFEAELGPAQEWVNGVDVISLDVELDCRTASGDAVVGSYHADRCE